VNDKVPYEFDVTTALHLPMSERVLDRLADILYATDEILGMVQTQTQTRERLPDPSMASVEMSMQRVYEQVNELMKQLAD
jgi:protein-tyrosine-phosphatase